MNSFSFVRYIDPDDYPQCAGMANPPAVDFSCMEGVDHQWRTAYGSEFERITYCVHCNIERGTKELYIEIRDYPGASCDQPQPIKFLGFKS